MCSLPLQQVLNPQHLQCLENNWFLVTYGDPLEAPGDARHCIPLSSVTSAGRLSFGKSVRYLKRELCARFPCASTIDSCPPVPVALCRTLSVKYVRFRHTYYMHMQNFLEVDEQAVWGFWYMLSIIPHNGLSHSWGGNCNPAICSAFSKDFLLYN
jgi:hypothetical protein